MYILFMISVVIPAYNEEKLIGLCLDALVRQKTRETFEVIVVNNNSIDKTEEIVKSYKNQLNVTIILEKSKGRGAARFTGFKAAKGDIILSTDADVLVPPYWIERMTNTLKNSHAVALAGIGKLNEGSFTTKTLYLICQSVFLQACRVLYGYYWLTGFNFAIYKTAYLKSGGFNPELNVNEDCTLAAKVNKVGKIAFTSKMPVAISARRFRKGFLKALWMYLRLFLMYLIFKKEKTVLSDIR